MPRKIPSHSALIAFEAAARHGHFARAAEELSLTEGAISRQIARLEAFLGVLLFERTGNRVQLLPNGARYATQIRQLLDRLDRDSQYMMGQTPDSITLDIATLPTFAMRWLIPRLTQFQQHHPNITVHLTEKVAPFMLAESEFDAVIHFIHPAWAGMRVYPLLHEVLIPVCHPKFLSEPFCENGQIPSLDNLPRLHQRQNPDAWQRYAVETGITLTNPAIGARYELHAMLIEAALAELGVILVPRFYVEKELAEGRLVAPWITGTSVSKTFCLVLSKPIGLMSEPVQLFANWLQEEAKKTTSKII